MNRELFKDALSSIIVTSDFVEFIESGKSFILDTLIGLGCSDGFAESFLMEIGLAEQERSSALLEEIEAFGLEPEFENWLDQDELFEEIRDSLIRAVQIGHQASRNQVLH